MDLLFCLGLVWIIKDSYILKPPREYIKSKSTWMDELLSCSLCLGFWAGLLVSLVKFFNFELISLSLLFFPVASSAFCWFMDSLLDLIQYLIVKVKK